MTRAVDLFAGLGGFTAGAKRAGCEVVWAANHNPLAVAMHELNHPGTEHAIQDLNQANFTTLPPYDLLLASPACQGHSSASQPCRLPKHDQDRSTAWAVVSCLEATEPRAAIIENVPYFRRWRLYGIWRQAIEMLGYKVTESVFVASDHGTPQERPRLFVFASKTGAVLEPAFEPGGCAADFVDLDGPGNWAPVASKRPGCRRRAELGRRRFGDRPFIVHHSTDHKGRCMSRPLGVITTKHQWGVCRGDEMRMLTGSEYRAGMGFRPDYEIPAKITEAVRLLGNAVPPTMARAVVASAVERM